MKIDLIEAYNILLMVYKIHTYVMPPVFRTRINNLKLFRLKIQAKKYLHIESCTFFLIDQAWGLLKQSLRQVQGRPGIWAKVMLVAAQKGVIQLLMSLLTPRRANPIHPNISLKPWRYSFSHEHQLPLFFFCLLARKGKLQQLISHHIYWIQCT